MTWCAQCGNCSVAREGEVCFLCKDANMPPDEAREPFFIPTTPEAFPEGGEPTCQPDTCEQDLYYEPREGDRVRVVQWIQYPSYDFIFGVPDKGSRRYGEEVAFFQYRDTRTKTVKEGMWLDVQELCDIIEGFRITHLASVKNSPHLWNEKKQG